MSVSVAELFPGVGSVVPTGAAIVAVFARDPTAVETIVPVAVNVAVPPTARSTDALMLPLPEAGQLEPGDGVQVQLTPARVAGNVSATVPPVIADGPTGFEATMVYVIDWPGTADV